MSDSPRQEVHVASEAVDTDLPPFEIPPGLRRARTLARVMDASVGLPGTRFRFGLDAILGLVPGLGDAIGTALAAYIVGVAVRLGAPKSTLLAMLWNIGVEAFAGSVPVVGDLFDAAWRSNVRNVRLLERHLGLPATESAGRGTVVVVGITLLFLVGLSVWVSLKAALWIVTLISVAGPGAGG